MEKLEKNFFSEVEKLCQSAMKHCQGLTEALQYCEGLFPTLAVPKFIALNDKLANHWISNATLTCTSDYTKQDSFALSNWTFSSNNRRDLSSRLWKGSDRICLLGVPSLVEFLPELVSSGKSLLIDLSKTPDLNQEKALHLTYDINLLDGSEFSNAFDVCLLDPPWYVPECMKWINVATSYCKDGGIVAFPLMGRMTKPSASLDREKVIRFCKSMGLEIQIHQKCVLYDPPSFERSILLRNGIPPVQWKRADLVIAKRSSKRKSIDEPAIRLTPTKPIEQYRIGMFTVEIIMDRFINCGQKLVQIPQGGYWMKTPSRRERGIAECNVFVSNGARFISQCPFDLAVKLETMSGLADKAIQPELFKLGFPVDVFPSENNHAYFNRNHQSNVS